MGEVKFLGLQGEDQLLNKKKSFGVLIIVSGGNDLIKVFRMEVL